MSDRPLLVVFATLDPRANKIGGIETHIRHILRNHPDEVDLLLAGIDEIGDLRPGTPVDLSFGERNITFLPLARIPAEEARVSAARLSKSTTLRFVLGGIRHLTALRRLIRDRLATADLPRVEFAVLPYLLGLPYVLGIHADLAKVGSTDSLLKRYAALRQWSEGFAFRKAAHVFAVNPEIAASLLARYPFLGGRCDALPVPVDTALFSPTPFPPADPFRIAYAGRLDDVKDPELMFEAIAALEERMPGRVAFDLIGAADPTRFSSFARIARLTVRHGARSAGEVAAILRGAHCALMTSHSEGLPCFLLETLASGRAFVGTALPSFAPFIHSGQSGELVPRAAERGKTAADMATALESVARDISLGRLDPDRIAASVSHLAVHRVFEQLFGRHATIRGGGAYPTPSTMIASQAAR